MTITRWILFWLVILLTVLASVWVGLAFAKYYSTDHSDYRQSYSMTGNANGGISMRVNPKIPTWFTAKAPVAIKKV